MKVTRETMVALEAREVERRKAMQGAMDDERLFRAWQRLRNGNDRASEASGHAVIMQSDLLHALLRAGQTVTVEVDGDDRYLQAQGATGAPCEAGPFREGRAHVEYFFLDGDTFFNSEYVAPTVERLVEEVKRQQAMNA